MRVDGPPVQGVAATVTGGRRSTPLPLLTAVLLLAAALRVLGTTDQSLWLDEGFTYNVIVRADEAWGALFAEIVRDTHPPLYFVLLRGWTLATGDSVLALRLFSGLTALVSVAVVYRLGRLLTADHAAPVVAALLLALWDADIFLAQETRMYAQRTLLACLSMWAYWRWSRGPSVWRAAPWALANAAMMYTQYLGGWVPLVQGIHALVCWRGRKLAGAVAALVVAGGLFAPWFVRVTLQQAATPPAYEMLNAPPSTLATLWELRGMYFGGLWALFFGLIGLAVYEGWRTRRAGVVLAGLWLVVPVAGTFAANTQFPLLMPRNLSLITPAAALLVALGWGGLARPARGLLLGVMVVTMLTSRDYYRPKPPWDALGAALAARAVPGDIALMEVGNGGYPLRYYLDHLLPPDVPTVNLPRARADSPATYYADLSALLATTDTVWLAHWSPDEAIFGVLADAGFVRTGTESVNHAGNALNAHRYDRLPDVPVAGFANGMRLWVAERYGGGVNLVWTTAVPLDRDYTVSAFLLDANGVLVAQDDGYPPRLTSAWAAGEAVHDPHELDLAALPPGDYTWGVKLYTWQDGVVVPTDDGGEFVVIAAGG